MTDAPLAQDCHNIYAPGMSCEMQALIEAVRMYTRDYPELNRLTQGYESSPRMIAFAVADALSLFNGTPPFTSFSLQQLLRDHHQNLLVRLTTVTLLESVAMLAARNHVNYSAGGLNLGLNDKAPLLMNFIQFFRASVDQQLLRVKVAYNVNSILGHHHHGVISEYWHLHSTFLNY